mmetsp:Transcript_31079/g.101289  ORF Transcript_31079/g.101289 Transcript_31079/m.101289 type:complete len:623 (-) Transcript_31079:186-2054(-)
MQFPEFVPASVMLRRNSERAHHSGETPSAPGALKAPDLFPRQEAASLPEGGGYECMLATLPVLAAAASDDVTGVQWSMEQLSTPVDLMADWFTPGYGPVGETLERKRRTPLMVAAMHGSVEVMSYLLNVGANPNLRSDDEEGVTALHCAAAGGSAQTGHSVELLINCGAERDLRDLNGRRAAEVLSISDPLAERVLGVRVEMTPSASLTPVAPSELDNEAYCTDEFRMFEFKIRRCTKTRAHDWTECPFTHPGEKARRRDPRRFNYCGSACPDFRKGSCRRGDACEFAHGVFECWLHPSRYRTQSCKDGLGCQRRVCFFAHSPDELRTPSSVVPCAGGLRPSPPASPTNCPSPPEAPHSPQPVARSGGDPGVSSLPPLNPGSNFSSDHIAQRLAALSAGGSSAAGEQLQMQQSQQQQHLSQRSAASASASGVADAAGPMRPQATAMGDPWGFSPSGNPTQALADRLQSATMLRPSAASVSGVAGTPRVPTQQPAHLATMLPQARHSAPAATSQEGAAALMRGSKPLAESAERQQQQQQQVMMMAPHLSAQGGTAPAGQPNHLVKTAILASFEARIGNGTPACAPSFIQPTNLPRPSSFQHLQWIEGVVDDAGDPSSGTAAAR